MPEFQLDLTDADGNHNEVFDWYHMQDEFTQGYVQAMFWTAPEDMGRPGRDVSAADLSQEARQDIACDCNVFQRQAAALLYHAEAGETSYDREQAGIDFWLTRNGHGAGFWCRDLPNMPYVGDIGERLSNCARWFGECDIYEGDDHLIYC